MLENGYVTPTYTESFGNAAIYGHSSITKLALEYNVQLHMDHLLCVLNNTNASMFSTIASIIEHGGLIDEDVYDDGNAVYPNLFVACSENFRAESELPPGKFKDKDEVMAVFLLA
jgi:hypothetical protein